MSALHSNNSGRSRRSSGPHLIVRRNPFQVALALLAPRPTAWPPAGYHAPTLTALIAPFVGDHQVPVLSVAPVPGSRQHELAGVSLLRCVSPGNPTHIHGSSRIERNAVLR